MIDINELNNKYFIYSDKFIYKILIIVLPKKFLKSITYNAIIDTVVTTKDIIYIRGQATKDIDESINDSYKHMIEAYEL